ncbi:response regulator [Dictyobacter alpinus]|uniref:response regulator n=1 Tax=Dictyobacter alpinus TaxID=2014873 RepID=UPI001386858B|nr:response regulator [Dictyobacter alpinus]
MARLIVVVDDSPTIRKILKVALGREGYEVKCFHSSHQLLHALFVTCETRMPDLLFVDLTLPGMDGFEVIKSVRAHPAGVSLPIFIISGRRGLVNRLRAWRSGADEYITKPFKVQEIVRLIRQHLPSGPC